MATTAKIMIDGGNPIAAVQDFLRGLMENESIGGVLVPMHLFGKGIPMPTLVTDPKQLSGADPLAPAFPMNSAKLLARLTRGQSGERIAAVMRPCEIRAFVELVKLNQGSLDDVILVGLDCMGAFDNTGYKAFREDRDPFETTQDFLGRIGNGGADIAQACKACEYPAPENADLVLGLAGADLAGHIPVMASSPRGESLLNGLGLPEAESANGRDKALAAMIETRTANRDEMFERTRAVTGTLTDLSEYLASCVNCYNCRVACPVCYCKECVFNTDVFEHKPWQYMGWAKRKGSLKMPTDTVFYHLTRMAHMSMACVGCGQCSNACPNDIPVMELFRTVAARTQESFDYVPGRSLDEPPPLSVFKEDEFQDAVSHMA
ncbi:Coenzyme F420 hydrogenase/dehydrogenase, beta subunit C-terminal domain [Pseudodesulfovibrio thermohalotolerans]|uniref:Coenzyme F420 hydrogenase/dehydrogenase, beta subunit C-terminal domain n=1 Tax=Pseudodesulfovibrio thermohalotolerans TaxID=2880651 RepID=UPI0024426E9C|nr:Coenzyme F420 hydrogenase/dehydrogenase, beta subunit C-terminal domain [Pseudodesulfovibrio thermohalotolerans]WFS61812.1 Coenzyme F420 hydrogenase/dehydrogenase, beta subunit C-terminal domain [Pseudodesulfovibrio thermohalotolerans]